MKKVKSSQSSVFSTARQYRHASLLHVRSRPGDEGASSRDEDDDVDGDAECGPTLSSTSRPVVARRYTREITFHARHSMIRCANNGSIRSIVQTRRSSPSAAATAMMVLMTATATAMVVQRVSATTRCSSSSFSSSSSGLRSASRSRLLAVHSQMLPVHPRIGRQLRVVRCTVCINSAGRTTEGERNATTNAARDVDDGLLQLSRAALEGREGRKRDGAIDGENTARMRERETEFGTAVVQGTPPSRKVRMQVGKYIP